MCPCLHVLLVWLGLIWSYFSGTLRHEILSHTIETPPSHVCRRRPEHPRTHTTQNTLRHSAALAITLYVDHVYVLHVLSVDAITAAAPLKRSLLSRDGNAPLLVVAHARRGLTRVSFAWQRTCTMNGLVGGNQPCLHRGVVSSAAIIAHYFDLPANDKYEKWDTLVPHLRLEDSRR